MVKHEDTNNTTSEAKPSFEEDNVGYVVGLRRPNQQPTDHAIQHKWPHWRDGSFANTIILILTPPTWPKNRFQCSVGKGFPIFFKAVTYIPPNLPLTPEQSKQAGRWT